MPVHDADWNPVTNLTHPLIKIDGDRIRALVYPWGACLLNGAEKRGQCITVDPEESYDYAHTGGTTAILPMNLNHADLDMPLSAAAHHYANNGLAAATVTYASDEYGIWADGELLPGLSDRDKIIIANAGLSGDWRWVEEDQRHRLIAAQVVNTTGFRPAKAHERQFALAASPGDRPNAIISQPDVSSGIMVALLPSDGEYSDLDDPHLTLIYGGSVGDRDQPDLDEMQQLVDQVADSGLKPITVRVAGAGELGQEGAWVAFVNGPHLMNLYHTFEPFKRSEHEGFLAHTTVSYDRDEPLRLADLPKEITFDRIALAAGPVWHTRSLSVLPAPDEPLPADRRAALYAALVEATRGT